MEWVGSRNLALRPIFRDMPNPETSAAVTELVFGGAFDPPHLGHLEAVRGLLALPRIARVLMIPTGVASLKSPHRATGEMRLEMLKILFEKEIQASRVEILDLEILRKDSFTWNTLHELKRLGRKSFACVIGTDQLTKLPQWHRFPEVISLCPWWVLARKTPDQPHGDGGFAEFLRSLPENLRSQFKLIPTQAPALSSTQIREGIAKTGLPPEGSLPEALSAYLSRAQVYGKN